VKKLAAALVPAAIACLAAPATGLAGLPNAKDPTIVVPRSIGGVHTGMKIDAADRAWGSNGDCIGNGGASNCTYRKNKAPEKGSGSIYSFEKNEVFGVSIDAYYKKDHFVFEGPLLDFETPEGIGLGDRARKVKKAYPKAKKIGNGYGYVIDGKGKSSMSFGTGGTKRITSVSLIAGPQG
jgi:hypothetical protein